MGAGAPALPFLASSRVRGCYGGGAGIHQAATGDAEGKFGSWRDAIPEWNKHGSPRPAWITPHDKPAIAAIFRPADAGFCRRCKI
jgi:hypothetical protein